MELIRGLSNLRGAERGGIIALGSFDGIHVGHRALLRQATQLAAAHGAPAMVLTFEPLPREYLCPDRPPARLTSWRERWRILARSQIDFMCVLRFGEGLRNLPAEGFAALLGGPLGARAVVIGTDFRFGCHGQGNADLLERAGRRLGFEVHVVPPVLLDGVRVSSSRIREALARADFALAARLLGRPYTMSGRVVRGQQLGRQLGYPTANLRTGRRRVPTDGIFAVRVHGVHGSPMAAVASLGTRPTIAGGGELLLEVHVFDFAGDLYGRELEVEFVAKLRAEARFGDLDALVVQMDRDARQAREILAAQAPPRV